MAETDIILGDLAAHNDCLMRAISIAPRFQRFFGPSDVVAEGWARFLSSLRHGRVSLYSRAAAQSLLRLNVRRALLDLVTRYSRPAESEEAPAGASANDIVGQMAAADDVAIVLEYMESMATKFGPFHAMVVGLAAIGMTQRAIGRMTGKGRDMVQRAITQVRKELDRGGVTMSDSSAGDPR
jgi:hypothetical protein